jgi:hypothetical protein
VSFAENKGKRALPQRGVASTPSSGFCAAVVGTTTISSKVSLIGVPTLGADLFL